MIKSIKPLLTAAALSVLMAGCSSSGKKTDAPVAENDTDAASAAAAAADAERRAREEALAAEKAKCNNAAKIYYFDFDESLLRAEARAALLVQADCIKKSGASIRLEGHADERGSREYNMALGERRANAVRDFLVLNGVSRSDVETVSYGEERPVNTSSSEAAWSENRRVELKK